MPKNWHRNFAGAVTLSSRSSLPSSIPARAKSKLYFRGGQSREIARHLFCRRLRSFTETWGSRREDNGSAELMSASGQNRTSGGHFGHVCFAPESGHGDPCAETGTASDARLTSAERWSPAKHHRI